MIGFPAILSHRVDTDILQPVLRLLYFIFRDITPEQGVIDQLISPEIDCILGFILFKDSYHRGVTKHSYPLQGINVFHVPGNGGDIPRRVQQLGVTEHLSIVQRPVVDKGVRPGFLVFCQHMDIPGESVLINHTIVHSGVRGQHVLASPGMGT